MPSARSPWRRPALWFLLTTALASGCDLSTKSWAQHTLGVPGRSVSVLDPWLELSLAYNRGTAFSVIPRLGDAMWLLALLAVAVCGLMLWLAIRSERRIELLAMALVAGGALGNGYDRAFRLTPAGDTAVVDFIRVNLTSSYSWPTFNLADAWLAIGVALLLVAGLRRARDEVEPHAARA